MSTTADPVPTRRKVGRPKGGGGTQARKEIIDSAAKLFSENGFRATSMSAIAADAGISQTGLVHHFPSKDHLLTEVLERRDVEDLTVFGDGQSRGFEILDSWEELLRHNQNRPGLVRLFTAIAGESVDPHHPGHTWLRAHHDRALADIAGALQRGIEDGTVRPEIPVTQVARLVMAVSDGLQLQWLGDPEHVDMPREFSAFADSLRARWAV